MASTRTPKPSSELLQLRVAVASQGAWACCLSWSLWWPFLHLSFWIVTLTSRNQMFPCLSFLNVLEVCSEQSFTSLTEIHWSIQLVHQPQNQLLRSSTPNWLPVRLWTISLDSNWHSQFFIHPAIPTSSPSSPSLAARRLCQRLYQNKKFFQWFLPTSSMIHRGCLLLTESNWVGQVQFALCRSVMAVHSPLLSLMCLEMDPWGFVP